MGDASKNFNKSEFACKCCGKNNISQTVILYCQRIRDTIDRPLIIECGTRCEKHNAELAGSVKNSAHLAGLAADVRAKGMTNTQLGRIIKQMYYAGELPSLKYCYLIKGQTNTSVHFDIDASKKRFRVFAF